MRQATPNGTNEVSRRIGMLSFRGACVQKKQQEGRNEFVYANEARLI